jgi:hypothetical protein
MTIMSSMSCPMQHVAPPCPASSFSLSFVVLFYAKYTTHFVVIVIELLAPP